MASPKATCHLWLKGNCRKGDKCQWLHSSLDPAVTSTGGKQDRRPSHRQRSISRVLKTDTTKLICSLEPSELAPGSDLIKVTDYQFLTSYNWSNAKTPTIYVPGFPPRWTSPQLPRQLPKDKGLSFIDQNAHRGPISPFDPFFKSLLTTHPKFDMSCISLVTDRNNLRKLLNFASARLKESFRIEVDIVQNTMFFIRWEEHTVRNLVGGHVGYGHEFEKAFTTFPPDLVNSLAHHRIVQYKLGGINCIVRFEADACLEEPSDSTSTPSDTLASAELSTPAEFDLSSTLKSLSLKPGEQAGPSQTKNEVTVIRRGSPVPPSSVIELKSRSSKRLIDLRDVIPQLWFSQTEHLFVGYHGDGLISEEVARYPMAEHFAAWESRNQEPLGKLVGLIGRIREAVEGSGGKRAVCVYDHTERPKRMKIYGATKTGLVVPTEVLDTCWE